MSRIQEEPKSRYRRLNGRVVTREEREAHDALVREAREPKPEPEPEPEIEEAPDVQ